MQVRVSSSCLRKDYFKRLNWELIFKQIKWLRVTVSKSRCIWEMHGSRKIWSSGRFLFQQIIITWETSSCSILFLRMLHVFMEKLAEQRLCNNFIFEHSINIPLHFPGEEAHITSTSKSVVSLTIIWWYHLFISPWHTKNLPF